MFALQSYPISGCQFDVRVILKSWVSDANIYFCNRVIYLFCVNFFFKFISSFATKEKKKKQFIYGEKNKNNKSIKMCQVDLNLKNTKQKIEKIIKRF